MSKISYKAYSISIFMLTSIFFSQNGFAQTSREIFNKVLHENWKIHPAAGISSENETKVSLAGFETNDWYKASVPSTVLGTLLKNNRYPEIFKGDNLRSVDKSEFENPWWYRTEFEAPKDIEKKISVLQFDGINYRADIWLNGNLAGRSDTVAGAFRQFEFNVSRFIKPGKNVLAVKVTPPQKGEPTMGFVDWNPRPPDANMGLWREVKLKVSGDVSINFPFVKTKVDLATLKSAELTVSAEIVNHKNTSLNGTLTGRIGNIKFSKNISFSANSTTLAEFSPEDFRQLKIKNPKLWWPHTHGAPYVYSLELTVTVEGKTSDIAKTNFGIREVSDYLTADGHRGYKVNGKEVLITGGGWVDNLFLDQDIKNLEAQVQYVKHMRLNTIRLEGFWGANEDLYNLCDKYGVLLMAGWSCQWEWPVFLGKEVDDFGGIKTPEDIKLISLSWRDQIKWLRNHPSILVWVSGSDKTPRPELEKNYLSILKNDDPTRNYLASAAKHTSEVSGPSAVKMNGPYEYVPPVYWWTDRKNGGAFGFNTETGPGPQVPPLETIKKMIPADHLWPIDSVWNYHCGGNMFNTLKVYNNAIDKRLGQPQSLEQYCTKAQYTNYEGMRAMYEAFSANKYNATGVIQWMLNAAWPKLWWQLYDYYLLPNGAFYGAKKALEPLHLTFNYESHQVSAINSTPEEAPELKAVVRVLNFDLTEKFTKEENILLKADEVRNLTVIPAIEGLSNTYFLSLSLKDKNGKTVSSNFYCLSNKQDSLDVEKTTWYYTPQKEYADMSQLNNLPKVKLDVKHHFKNVPNGREVEVSLVNHSSSLAFQVDLSLLKGKEGASVAPIFWDDNYFELLPGETRVIKGYFENTLLEGKTPELKVSGWNIE